MRHHPLPLLTTLLLSLSACTPQATSLTTTTTAPTSTAPASPWKSLSTNDLAAAYRAASTGAFRLNETDREAATSGIIEARSIKEEQSRRAGIWWTQHPNCESLLPTLDDVTLFTLLAAYDSSIDPFYLTPSSDEALTYLRRHPLILRQLLEHGGWDDIIAQDEWPLLTGLPDQRLQQLWPATTTGPNREHLLAEMARRPNELTIAFLTSLLALAKDTTLADLISKPNSLQILTALRRAQGKPDPLTIVPSPLQLQSTFPELPQINVAFLNVDVDHVTLPLTLGGDYRSGRPQKWKIDAIDSNGHNLGPRKWHGGMDGGFLDTLSLAFAERHETNPLYISSFTPLLVPGTYTLHIYYHNQNYIADRTSLDDLIVFSAPPVTLTVKPLILTGGPETLQKVKSLFHQIDPKPPLTLIAGTYGEWAYKHPPPDSPQAQILALQFEAIPALLQLLEDPTLDPPSRAQLLSLLFSLTNQNDPSTEPGILPPYNLYHGPSSITGAFGTALISHGEQNNPSAAIDLPKQKSFATHWLPWKTYILSNNTRPL